VDMMDPKYPAVRNTTFDESERGRHHAFSFPKVNWRQDESSVANR